jgi:hypothetical protein
VEVNVAVLVLGQLDIAADEEVLAFRAEAHFVE